MKARSFCGRKIDRERFKAGGTAEYLADRSDATPCLHTSPDAWTTTTNITAQGLNMISPQVFPLAV